MSSPFFVFGLDDAFISKTAKGIADRDLPDALYSVVHADTTEEVYHVALGPVRESWVCCYKDVRSGDRISFGPRIPKPLRKFLSTTPPSPHLKVTLGPDSSFFAWSPSSIRWCNLPDTLEETLQSWLSPAGWKVGPPRMVSLGAGGAWFAVSEYGEGAWGFGDEGAEHQKWEIWQETMNEWQEEAGFDWDDVAYINLDPTHPDQFIAIRHSKTWAGSIDDSNAPALETFAAQFFSKPKSRPQNPETSSSSQQRPKPPKQQNSTTRFPKNDTPEPTLQAHYEEWSLRTATLFAAALPTKSTNPQSPKLLTGFPSLPTALTTCTLPSCTTQKAQTPSLGACKHDIETLYRSSGLYSYEFLRTERLRWHPDRFGRLCSPDWREEGRKLAEEMWKMIDGLMGEEEKRISDQKV